MSGPVRLAAFALLVTAAFGGGAALGAALQDETASSAGAEAPVESTSDHRGQDAPDPSH